MKGKANKKGRATGMQSILKKFDLFGVPLPAFNVEGETRVTTYAGCFASLLVLALTLLFAMLKLRQLVSRQNPFVNTFVKVDAYGDEEIFATGQNSNFMMAFALEDYITGEIKDESRFLKWYAEYTIEVDNVKKARSVPIKTCTADDLAKFETPERRSKKRLKGLEAGGGLLCVDWASAGVDLWGSAAGSSGDSATLDVQVLPCGVKETLLGAEEDNIPSTCNQDKQAAIDYIGPMQMVVVYNEGRFQPDEFSQSRINYRSVVRQIQADELRPHSIDAKINKNLLADDTSFLQWGDTDYAEFETIEFGSARPSSRSSWPSSQNSDGLYMFSSIHLSFGQDQTIIERQTYSTLDWLADVGGLSVALVVLAGLIVAPIAAFSLQSDLIAKMFRYLASRPEQISLLSSPPGEQQEKYQEQQAEQDDVMINQEESQTNSAVKQQSLEEPSQVDNLEREMTWEFNKAVGMKAMPVVAEKGNCLVKTCRKQRASRIRGKAAERVDRELDLVKFIHRQRLSTFALLALLTPEQRFVVDKMSIMLVRESSDSGLESEEDVGDLELEQENVGDVHKYARKVLQGDSLVDRQLTSIFKIEVDSRERKRERARRAREEAQAALDATAAAKKQNSQEEEVSELVSVVTKNAEKSALEATQQQVEPSPDDSERQALHIQEPFASNTHMSDAEFDQHAQAASQMIVGRPKTRMLDENLQSKKKCDVMSIDVTDPRMIKKSQTHAWN